MTTRKFSKPLFGWQILTDAPSSKFDSSRRILVDVSSIVFEVKRREIKPDELID